MYILDEIYFQDYEEIPNVNEADSKAAAELERFIDKYARQVIYDALGPTNTAALNADLVSGILPDTPESIWTKLVYGTTYTKDLVSYKWNGLLSVQGTSKSSLLADYVYYFWLYYKNTYMSGVGEIKGQAGGGTMVNSTQRLVTVWNNFVAQYQGSQSRPRQSYVNGVPFIDWFSECNNGNVTLFKFLKDNETDYPDCTFRTYDIKNQLGF